MPAEEDRRVDIEAVTGETEIPVAVFGDGETVAGEEEILAALDERFSENADAEAHRRKAAEHVWADAIAGDE